MTKKVFNIADALHSLAPGATWKYNDEDFSSLIWVSEDIQPPTEQDVLLEIAKLQAEYDAQQEAIAQIELDRESAKQSALAKLALLGLTEEEAKAVIGLG